MMYRYIQILGKTEIQNVFAPMVHTQDRFRVSESLKIFPLTYLKTYNT